MSLNSRKTLDNRVRLLEIRVGALESWVGALERARLKEEADAARL